MTSTLPALWTSAPTTGFSVPVMASTMAMKLSVSENVILSLMVRIMHSREVRPITLDGHRVTEETVSSVAVFFFTYIAILLLGTLVLTLDEIDFTAAFTASLTAISNVGPGLGAVGPTCNFGFLSGVSKLVMSAIMLLGRLEIMPLLVLLMPSVWRRK